MKGEWRSVTMENGGQYVITLGTTVMQRLCVDNLAMEQMVYIYLNLVSFVFHILFYIRSCGLLRILLWSKQWTYLFR